LLFSIAPRIARALWPSHIEDKARFQLISQSIIQVSSTLLYSLLYIPGYFGVQWYKKYEINKDLKKPWERDDWKTKRIKTLFLCLFNKAVIFPLYIFLVLKVAGAKLDF
jgi:hypothetical protein